MLNFVTEPGEKSWDMKENGFVAKGKDGAKWNTGDHSGILRDKTIDIKLIYSSIIIN